MAKENIAEEIFKLSANTEELIKGLQKVKGVYQELTAEQAKQVTELTILEKKEKDLLTARNKSSNPTTYIQLTKAIDENVKKMGALKESVDKFSNSSFTAKVEVDALSKSVSNAFKTTAVNGAISDMKRLEGAAAGATRSGFNPLNNSVNQLSRELPAFAVSANVGFLAISNNLPIFFDALQKINKENATLAANGQKTTSVLSQLGGAFFSVGTILSVGVTLLTIYGGKIIEWATELFEGEKALKSITEANDAFNKSILKTSREIVDLTIKLKVQRGELTKTEGELLKNENDRTNALNTNKELRKKSIDDLKKELEISDKLLANSGKTKQVVTQGGEVKEINILSAAEEARVRKFKKGLEDINRLYKIENGYINEKFNLQGQLDKLEGSGGAKAKKVVEAKIKAEIDLRDRIRQLYIDDTKNNEQREIEQVRFDNERAKREIAKLQVDENLKGQARLDAIKRLEAQKSDLQIALDKDLFNREEAIRIKYQKETEDAIKEDAKRTSAARIAILNEDIDFELYLLEQKYNKEKELGIQASDNELKRLQEMILAKKIAQLQEKASQDEVGKNAVERLAIENKLANDIEKLRADSNKRITEDEKRNNKERLNAYVDYFSQIVNAAIDATQKILALKIKEVDGQISQQERRVSAAKDIADRGNAELLQLEQDRLDALNKKREKYVRDQQALAAVELVANTAIAVSKAAAQGGVAAGVTIAAALIALVAGLASARSIASQAAYYEGGYTGDGNPREESQTMGGKKASRNYTWHKGEFVMDHKKTRQFRDIFEDVHGGRVDLREWKEKASAFDNIMHMRSMSMASPIMRAPVVNNVIQMKAMESKLDQLNSTMSALRLGLNVDENGFTEFMTKRMERKSFIDNLARA